MNDCRTMSKLGDLIHKIGVWWSYLAYRISHRRLAGVHDRGSAISWQEHATLAGWPRNHGYRIRQGILLPNFRLYERSNDIRRNYRLGMGSLLDIGCCRGYYVLDAALRFDHVRAIGVDVSESFIAEANAARECLCLDDSRVQFHIADFAGVARDPSSFGGPFDTVLLLGAYHYIYWGTRNEPNGIESHDFILRSLSEMCCGHVLLSARLEVTHLPRYLQDRANRSTNKDQYNLSVFQKIAARHFDIKAVMHLGKYLLMDLSKRNASPVDGKAKPWRGGGIVKT